MSEEIEVKAKDMGWAPKEEFRGDPEKWIDAETYVRRGEELMPILKANSRRTNEKLQSVETELKTTKDLLKEATESIEALKEFRSSLTKKEAQEKAKELTTAIVEAKREGDHEKEVELTEALHEHKAAIKEAEKPPEAKSAEKPEDPTLNPDWQAWVAENDWWGKDRRRTALAMGIADELKADSTNKLTGKAFLDKVTEEVELTVGGGLRTAPNKVEGGGRGSRNGAKGFGDLPAEAKQACERQAERLVGPNRAFKTAQEWRNHYATEYFAEE